MTASTVVQENKGIKKYEYSEEHSVIKENNCGYVRFDKLQSLIPARDQLIIADNVTFDTQFAARIFHWAKSYISTD